MNLVEQHYDKSANEEWRRLERRRTEYAITLKALIHWLPTPTASIIDIGGGPGRYAIDLARLGYSVTLVDVSSECVNLARKKAEDAQVSLAGFVHGDAIQLNEFESGSFDAALLLGPLYHLIERSERDQALREAVRVLKESGRLFAAFITRFAPFRFVAIGDPAWLLEHKEYARQLLETGVHDQPPETFTNAYYAQPEEVLPFMEQHKLKMLSLIGCEGIIAGHEEKVNELQGEAWEAWVDLNYRLGQEPSLYGASDHLLYIGEKSG
jgi:S-adenosylmethionine-dependent methyltransferase